MIIKEYPTKTASTNTIRAHLEKLKKRNQENLKVKEVYLNSELSVQAFDFLKKQSYLKFSNINIILKNTFDINFPFGNVLLNEKNEIIKEKKNGFEARVLQHEIDHLEGKLFIDYLSSLKRNIFIKRVKKLKKLGEI